MSNRCASCAKLKLRCQQRGQHRARKEVHRQSDSRPPATAKVRVPPRLVSSAGYHTSSRTQKIDGAGTQLRAQPSNRGKATGSGSNLTKQVVGSLIRAAQDASPALGGMLLRCEACDLSFSSTQALGGHRKNSTVPCPLQLYCRV